MKLDWHWYLYTNELPHLPFVTYLEGSHFLETKWNQQRVKIKLMDMYPPRMFIKVLLRRRHSWILRDAKYVRSEAERIV